jgi:MFS family permease
MPMGWWGVLVDRVTRALAAAPLLALAAACAAGGVAGGVLGLVLMARASESDGWAALGAFVAGLVLGVSVAAVAYVLALVVAARLLFPAGRRAGPVLLALLGPVAVTSIGAALLAPLRPTAAGASVAFALFVAAAAGCGPAAFVWCGASGRLRRAAVAVVAVPALAAGAVAGVAHVVGQAREERVVARVPLVLFDGDTADPDLAGWRRDAFDDVVLRPAGGFTDRGREGYLKYFTPSGVTFVTMHTDAGDCSAPAAGYTCARAGALPAGELRRYLRSTPYGSYPRSAGYLALVYPDGSAVSVNVSTEQGSLDGPALEPARALLGSLQRVARGRFEDRTDARVTLAQ